MSVDARTYLEQKRHFVSSKPGCINQRLINIDLDHILLVELQLLLRITD